jgi:hypothetical protein
MQYQQVADQQPRTRIFISGPGRRADTAKSDWRRRQRARTKPIIWWTVYTEENAQRLDMAAAKKFRRAEALTCLKGAGDGAKARQCLQERAKQIRDALGKVSINARGEGGAINRCAALP